MSPIERRDRLMKRICDTTIRLSREELTLVEKFKLKRQQKKDLKEVGIIIRHTLGLE